MRIFITPREVVWGRGSISHLENIKGKRAIIVTDKNMAKLGIVAKAEHYLKKAGLEVKVFDEVEPEPSINTVMKLVEQHKGFSPDVIVGLGGGSSMDASKAFRIFFEHPHLTFEGVRYFDGPPKTPVLPFKKTISVGVPSTSGTGSEVSYGCVVNDPTIPAKCVIAFMELVPNVAILDPDIADSMPKSVQADTGLDALSHAMPAYVSVLGNDFSSACALQAIVLIMRYLPLACIEGDKDAKEHMHYAASLAGKAFANSGVGIEHIIGTMFGGRFHISHGRACGIALPYMIKFNASVAGDRFAELARAVGYNGSDQSEAVDYLVQRTIELRKQLGIPDSYREAGVPEDVYLAELKGFIEKSPGSPAIRSNPRQCTDKEWKELYDASYYGDYNIIG